MLQLERKEKILKYINDHKVVTTKALCDEFGMTPVTIRSDINSLAQCGLIIKTHGGAMSAEHRLNMEIPISQKIQQNSGEKQAIAQRAVQLIQPGDTVILDSGSTTLEIAKLLDVEEVTVITNDVLIAKVLIDRGRATVYLTGGRNIHGVYALHGAETEEYLKQIRVNKLFLGCDAIDPDWGISNRTIEEVPVKRAMIHSSREVIAVADSGKLCRQVFARVCSLDEIDVLITEGLPEDLAEQLRQKGIQVLQ